MRSQFIFIFKILFFVQKNCGLHNKEFLQSNNINNLNLTLQKSGYDFNNIIHSLEPFYVDVGVIVLKETIDLLQRNSIDKLVFLAKIFKEISNAKKNITQANTYRILLWHNFEFSANKVEYWENGNKVRPVNEFDTYTYQKYIEKHNYDYDTFIIFGVYYEVFDSYSTFGTFCTTKSVSIINVRNYLNRPNAIALNTIHELGHSFSFDHMDTNDNCSCVLTDKIYCPMNEIHIP
ncbi:hypothetical protein HZS_3136, partial [Henneguya salminicola]